MKLLKHESRSSFAGKRKILFALLMNCKGRKFRALASAEMSSSDSQNSENNALSSSECSDTESTSIKLPQQIVKNVQLKSSHKKGAMHSKPYAKKTSAKKLKERKWAEDELFIFANVLVNDGFGNVLEMLALKRSSNAEVFRHVKNLFNKALVESGHTDKELPLDTSVEKLRKKYTNLKGEFGKITNRIKTGSGLAASKEPKWYSILNKVFAERYANLDLCSEAADTSFVRNQDANELENDENENEEENDVTKKAKLVVENLKRRIPTSRSQTQAMAELAKSIDRSIEAQNKRTKMFADEERERHATYLKFKEEEGERNRNMV